MLFILFIHKVCFELPNNMSEFEEDIVLVPWVGPNSHKNTLTVIVLSLNIEIVDRISEALIEVHKNGNYSWKLIVLRSFHLDDVAKQSNVTGGIALDLIIVAIDTSRLFCLDWAKQQLLQVDPDLRRRRVVLINAGGLPVKAMAISPDELISFQSDSKLDMFTADVINDNPNFLARRLLKYIEVSVGVNTGIPNLNI